MKCFNNWQTLLTSLHFEEGIENTVKWYLEIEDWMNNIISKDYEKYYSEMYKGKTI